MSTTQESPARPQSPPADVRPFPAERIFRRQLGFHDDQVAVTHLGRTTVFPSPAALHAEVLKQYAPDLARMRNDAVALALKIERGRRAEQDAAAAARRDRLWRGAALALAAGAYAGVAVFTGLVR